MSYLSTCLCHALLIALLAAAVYGDNPTTPDVPTTTPEPPITWFECPDQYSYHDHPSNCTQYIICVFGKAYLRACEGGLNWNDRLKNCDWPNPKTGCQQIDENTAYRPDVSPVVTDAPFPSESENFDADNNNWQSQSGGKFGGSQPFSRFKPDEDAARNQLSDFAGKKVVYFDAAANDQSARQPPNDGGNSQKSQQFGDQFADADSSRAQGDHSTQEQTIRKRPEEMFLPIGQIRRSEQPSGQPLKMSSWDTGNDDFPAPSDQQNSGPQQQQQRPTPQPQPQPATNAPGNAPPWAIALLARRNGRPPISRDPPPPAQSWSSNQDDDNNQPQRQSPPVRNQIPRPNNQGRNPGNDDSIGTPPPPTMAPGRPERPPQRPQQPPPPPQLQSQRQNGQNSWPNRGQDSSSDQTRDQSNRGRPDNRDSGMPPSQSRQAGNVRGRPAQAPERSSWNSADDQSADSLPSLRQTNVDQAPPRGSPNTFQSQNIPDRQQSSQRGNPNNFQPQTDQDQQPSREPQNRPSSRPNSFASTGDRDDSSQGAPRRENPSPFSPNAITDSFNSPTQSQRGFPHQSDDAGQAPRNSPNRQSSFGNFGASSDGGDSSFGSQSRPDGQSSQDSDDNSGFQMTFATRRPRPDSSRFGQNQPPPTRSQGDDLSSNNQRQAAPNRLQVHNLFSSDNSDDDSTRQNAPPAQNSRRSQPADGQDNRQWSGFGPTDDISIKDQITQLSQRFPGVNDDSGSASSFGGQNSPRSQLQFPTKPTARFPFESESTNQGTGQRFPFENSQEEGAFSQNVPVRTQLNTRSTSLTDGLDQSAPSMPAEQEMRQFYAGI